MRAEKKSANRVKVVKARLTEDEFLELKQMEARLGKTCTDIIRANLFRGSQAVMVNATDLLALLDSVGAELGRSGNNINQLARHANIGHKEGRIDSSVFGDFNELFRRYILNQQELEKVLRQIIRLMKS